MAVSCHLFTIARVEACCVIVLSVMNGILTINSAYNILQQIYIYIYITGYTSSFKFQTLHELLLAVTPPPYWDWYAYLCACLWLCLFLQSRRCSKTERAKDNALVSHVPNKCWQTSSWSSWSSFEFHFVLRFVFRGTVQEDWSSRKSPIAMCK